MRARAAGRGAQDPRCNRLMRALGAASERAYPRLFAPILFPRVDMLVRAGLNRYVEAWFGVGTQFRVTWTDSN